MTAADGRFTVRVNSPLADGAYSFSVVATDASGQTAASDVPQVVVIDTVGPRVVGLNYDPIHGRILVTLADDRSGLDPYALIDGANYHYGRNVPGHPPTNSAFAVSSLTTTPSSLPTDPQTLVILINRGKSIPRGRFLLTIDSAGVRAPRPATACATWPATPSTASSTGNSGRATTRRGVTSSPCSTRPTGRRSRRCRPRTATRPRRTRP